MQNQLGWKACLSPILLLAVWWWVARTGTYSSDVLVAPGEVFKSFIELVKTGELQRNLQLSLTRLFIGFSLGATAGILFGVSMATSRKIEAYFSPLFHAIRQVPTITLIPILILLLGVDESFKIVIVTQAALLTVALAAYDATKGVSRNYYELAEVYHLSRFTLYRKIILPAILPQLMTGLRIAFARSWTILVASELLASETGIGQMMQLGRDMFRLDVVMVGVVVTGVVGFSLDRLLKWGELRLIPWRQYRAA